ncbi:MAG: helix-turn-helix domain-containing protein [Planctomycetes bacterium]|nr:helix-turn-helix domain-containing protein [Planctomycetota bacterium]
MKPGEVAHVLGVHVEVVRRWWRQGRLPGLKIGGQMRFKPEDLEDWIEEQKADSRPRPPLRGTPPMSEAYQTARKTLGTLLDTAG